MPRQRRARRRVITFVEDQIDHAQHAVQPRRQIRARRHLIRNARIANLRLRAHDALGERGRGREKGARDLLGREPADFAQRERDLRVRREGRMAAGEDEAQAIVFYAFLLGFRCDLRVGVQLVGKLGERCIEPRAPADLVDRLEAARRNEPRARIVRHAVALPLLDCRGECVVQRFLREVEAAEEPDERCEHAARLGAVNRVDGRAHAPGCVVVHRVIGSTYAQCSQPWLRMTLHSSPPRGRTAAPRGSAADRTSPAAGRGSSPTAFAARG